MTTTAAPPSRGRDRRIALLKPASLPDERVAHAMQLLNSMLWAFKGATASPWITVTPDEAEVIVVHRDDRDQRLRAWKASGKILVEIATSERANSVGSHSLVYPFRAAQVLALLEELDEEIATGTASTPALSESWSFSQALRNLREPRDRKTWLVARHADAPVLWVRCDAEIYRADASTLQSIRGGSIPWRALTLQETSHWPEGLAERAAAELVWFAAFHASDQLAPWLSPHSRYRLTRWPDFSSIRPPATQIRIAAALSAAQLNLEQLASRARVSQEEASRTLSALDACSAIASEVPAPAPAPQSQWVVPQPRGGISAFLRNVRKHLGLGI